MLGEGFSLRVIDAFLTVLAEDARFRNLPVVVTSGELAPTYNLPNLEIISGDPASIVATALPLVRLHAFRGAFEPHAALDRRRRIDRRAHRPARDRVRTRFLRPPCITRSSAAADCRPLRLRSRASARQFDGARIISRLMRQMDFGAIHDDGSSHQSCSPELICTTRMIARRLGSVMRHTTYGKRDTNVEPAITVATLQPNGRRGRCWRACTAERIAPHRD